MTLKEQIYKELEPIKSEDTLDAILNMIKSCKKDEEYQAGYKRIPDTNGAGVVQVKLLESLSIGTSEEW